MGRGEKLAKDQPSKSLNRKRCNSKNSETGLQVRIQKATGSSVTNLIPVVNNHVATIG